MSDITDAIGTAAEGGLFAKAVSGKAGSLTDKTGNPIAKGHFAEGTCLNCGTELLGEHCHVCGQKAHLHRTIGAFLHDLLHGALHLDGKTWRTLPMLIGKPGELTRRYIEGERARFVSPMALFLFSVFLMFAVFQAIGLTTPSEIQGNQGAQLREFAANEVERLEQRRADIAEELSATGLEPAARAALEQQLEDFDGQLAGIREAEQEIPFFRDLIASPESTSDEVVAGVPLETEEDGTTVVPLSIDGKTKMNIGSTGVDWIDGGLNKWRTNPGLMLYKLQANAYKFSWLLIPLSIPFVWLLFVWKRRFKAYDHAIFVTYSIAFMSLLFITLSLLTAAGIGGGWVFLALAVVPPFHIYKHMKYSYGLSRFSTIWRLVLLFIFIVVVVLLFLQLLLLLGAF